MRPKLSRITDISQRAATHASSLRSLQHELDISRDAAETARKYSEDTSLSTQDEINQWRDRCDGLEDEIRRLEDEKAAVEARDVPGGVCEFASWVRIN